jgi:hypothetical protein
MMVRMPDSDAVRSRRKRAHAQGDHHLCRHAPPPLVVVSAGDVPGVGDPVAGLRELAARLEGVHRAEPSNVPVARELRLALATLAGLPAGGDKDDPLAELRSLMGPS